MQHKNRPPHLYFDNYYYFLTSRTLRRAKLFDTDKKKKILLDVIFRAIQKFNYDMVAWVVLSNHYHILLKVKNADQLPKLVGNIHTNSSRLLNINDNFPGRKIWWNYWDKCIRDDSDFWKHFNYIHHNPIKHGYANSMQEYLYSSYNSWIKKKGIEWMESCFRLYLIVDFTVQDV
ncbi:MAG: transposase [bacterium]|nr:transposase [bacterium]